MRAGDDVDEEDKDCGVIDSGLVADRDLPLFFCRGPERISKECNKGMRHLLENVRWHLRRFPLNKIVCIEAFGWLEKTC